MYNRSKILALAVLLCLPVGLLVSIPTQYQERINKEPARFVISSWVNDDGFGQGISVIYVHENSTGAWLPFTDPAFRYPTDSAIIEVNFTANTALRVGPTFTLNHSVYSLANIDAGINIIRSNVTVYNSTGLCFEENNITILSGGNQTPTTYWYYAYSAFDFLIAMGEIYRVTITYEIYYPEVIE